MTRSTFLGGMVWICQSVDSGAWRGAEIWFFHESPSYPHMYCFLAWRERMESSTEKTLRWNTIVIGDFLNLGSVTHKCRQYQFLRDDNVTKGWRDFFQRESHQ